MLPCLWSAQALRDEQVGILGTRRGCPGSRQRRELVSTLEAKREALAPADAQALRDEQVGILEHEAGLSRIEAEARAGIHP